MIYIENPPNVNDDTKWVYEQMLRLAELVQKQQEEIDALKETLANS